MKKKPLSADDARYYSYKGSFYKSVTSIQKLKAKGEGFMRWLVSFPSYEKMIKLRNERRDTGLMLHKFLASLKRENLGRAPGRIKNHIKAFRTFCQFYNPKPIYMEEVVIDTVRGYAGTMDFFGWITYNGQRTLAVLDWKTSKSIHQDQFIQPAAYLKPIVLAKRYKCNLIGIIRLDENGKFDPKKDAAFMSGRDLQKAYKTFLHLKGVSEWEDYHTDLNLKTLVKRALRVARPKIIVKNKGN